MTLIFESALAVLNTMPSQTGAGCNQITYIFLFFLTVGMVIGILVAAVECSRKCEANKDVDLRAKRAIFEKQKVKKIEYFDFSFFTKNSKGGCIFFEASVNINFNILAYNEEDMEDSNNTGLSRTELVSNDTICPTYQGRSNLLNVFDVKFGKTTRTKWINQCKHFTTFLPSGSAIRFSKRSS